MKKKTERVLGRVLAKELDDSEIAGGSSHCKFECITTNFFNIYDESCTLICP